MADAAMNEDWPAFPGCTFEILGVDGSSIKFVSRSVLAKRVLLSGAIAFDVTVTIDVGGRPYFAVFDVADYNSLRGFRNEIDAICKGGTKAASMHDGRVTIRVRRHRYGVRERLLVEGEWSSYFPLSHPEIRDQDSLADYLTVEAEPAISGRFAFVTACVDPPYLETSVSQMDEILCALEAEGFKP
jgi:hypothetical protein